MKITEEDFKKLNQLDRIEFRQRYELLNKNSINLTLGLFALLFLFLMNCIIITLLIYAIAPDLFYLDLLIIRSGSFLFSTLLTLFILIDIATLFKNRREREKLIKQYFKIELIKKK